MEDLLISLKDGLRIIRFNRPARRNAITPTMYVKINNILKEDAVNDEIVATVLTGTGDFYSSGNDFKESLAMNPVSDDSERRASSGVGLLIDAMINYPKLLIAVVNGPAIGVAATTVALCDIVYATENAWFQTPFMQLGLCPEGCSSYTFPRILGRSKASEMLFLNEKLSAEDAFKYGFVSKVIPKQSVNDFIEQLKEFGKLPVHSVKATKELILNNVKHILCECNKRECNKLEYMFTTDTFINAVLAMMNKKNQQSKL